MNDSLCCPKLTYVHLGSDAEMAIAGSSTQSVTVPYDMLVQKLSEIGIQVIDKSRGSMWRARNYKCIELPIDSSSSVVACMPTNQLEGVTVHCSHYYCPTHLRVYQVPTVDRLGDGLSRATFELLTTEPHVSLDQDEARSRWRQHLEVALGYVPELLFFDQPVVVAEGEVTYFMDPSAHMLKGLSDVPVVYTLASIEQKQKEIDQAIAALHHFQ